MATELERLKAENARLQAEIDKKPTLWECWIYPMIVGTATVLVIGCLTVIIGLSVFKLLT